MHRSFPTHELRCIPFPQRFFFMRMHAGKRLKQGWKDPARPTISLARGVVREETRAGRAEFRRPELPTALFSCPPPPRRLRGSQYVALKCTAVAQWAGTRFPTRMSERGRNPTDGIRDVYPSLFAL
jgi:hypothetical protein